MSLDPSVLHAMKDAGASVEVILAAIEAQAKVDEQRRERLREGNAQRQRNRRHGVSRRDERDPPNDIYSNPPLPLQSANADCCTPKFSDRIVEAWNAPGCFRKANPLRDGRLKKLQTRLKQFDEETLLKGIRCLSTSDWHTGRKGDWQANLGWYLQSEENVNKALEFADPGEPKTSSPLDRAESLERSATIYRRLGRDEDADRMEREAQELRCAA